jgi:two-component system cell cycle sensor histidine kinase/response regulator CckA
MPITGTTEGVSEPQKAEEARLESKDFLQNLFEAINDGIIVMDEDLNVLHANRRFEGLLGLQASPVGRKCYELFQAGSGPCAPCPALRTLETGQAQMEILPLQVGDRPHVCIEVSTYLMPNVQGSKRVVVACIKDITARKRMEEQLPQSQRMEALGRLAAGVAHDFNNMLTVIAGCSDFLLQHLTGQEELRRDVEEIQQAAEQATSLTRQLLAFGCKQMLKPQVLDLNSVVAGMDKVLLGMIGEDIHLVTILEPRLGNVKADPGQIGQMIVNLAVNAQESMPQGGRLVIETANFQADDAAGKQLDIPPGPYSVLIISDTGPGITPEAQAKIFEPFYTTKDSSEGTGLGLSAVYGIVTQSGGHIRLSSTIGEGTTFKIYLPQLTAPQLDTGLSQSRRVSLQGSETILLVEDEDLVREVTRRILERYGYTLLLARDGPEALRLMETYSGPLDLLLTDVIMPGMSGRELSERLASRHRHIKVLYISGYTENIIGEPGAMNPGIAFLQKPFKHFELALKVREVLDPQPGRFETPKAVAPAVNHEP